MPAFFAKLTRLSLPILLAILLLTAFTHVLAAPISPLPPGEGLGVRSIFAHLQADKRLYLLADAPFAGELLAPDDDWTGSGSVFTSTQPFTSAWALRSVPVVVFRSSVQDAQGQDVAWEFGDVAQILLNEIHLTHNVITETHILSGALDHAQILILPAFNKDYAAQVVSALTPTGLAALRDFVTGGGTVYAQGTGAYLLEAAGLLPAGTVNLAAALNLPPSANNLGVLQITQPDHRFTYNWQTNQMWLLNDPPVAANAPLTVIANYANTLGGAQPALLYGETGQGRIIISVGHPTSPLYPNQHTIFFAALLTGMSERAELHGRAIQTYDPTPGPTVIPAYEAGVPVSTTLCFSHLWNGTTLTNLQIVEEVNGNFTVDAASITPAPAAIELIPSGSLTNTRITWQLGDVTTSPGCLHYTAYTNRDSMAPGSVRFSTGFASYKDVARTVRWNHRDFMLTALVPARILGEHDKELDRFFHVPEEGLITDEFIFLENKEFSMGYKLRLARYIPLIAPIVGLEDQREPLATNAGETVWMSNTLFFYNAPYYPLPLGINFYTQTLNLDNWNGTTFVTMTTPGGYHADPLPLNGVLVDGFFVTIPPEYAHAIRVTADHKLLLPAIRVEWDLGDFPGFWYEMPAVRYGIQSGELFGRSVSFTGDPLVGSVVVDATGGSVYTGLGGDPLIRRELLAPVIVAPPQVPADTGLTYQDVWSRTHWLNSRAGFYDLFNWAACACGPGMGERHQRLNVTPRVADWVCSSACHCRIARLNGCRAHHAVREFQQPASDSAPAPRIYPRRHAPADCRATHPA
ncbi:MAG: hypothetical protein OHK0052_12720 [Anaerolineales bacterium]